MSCQANKLLQIDVTMETRLVFDPVLCVLCRNSAAQTVKQRLVFVGTEEGKLLALRQIFKEVALILSFVFA